ncbi:MAG TPA: hypothetical protein PLP01_08395, partial [Phycisphaerae bacterium]|nr:hypothetical protein [Phycisphaerae bacterium]
MAHPVLAASLFGLAIALAASPAAAGDPDGQKMTEISQYGITWTLDKPALAGQFVNGDWWVVGPVT